MAVFDSTFLIDALKERKEASEKLRELDASGEPLAVTPVSAFEVLRGVDPRRGKRLDQAVEFLRTLAVLEFDVPSALAAARIDADLTEVGRPLSVPDTMIAGIVLRHGERLITRDGDFARVRGLRVERY